MDLDLSHITLTGIDVNTNLSKVWMLSKKHSAVEWGLLYSMNPDGRNRYPKRPFLTGMVDWAKRYNINLSLHLCGEAVHELLKGNEKVIELAAMFPRIQLNFNHEKTPIHFGDLERFIAIRQKPVITQSNKNNQILATEIKSSFHQVLVDSSLGAGVPITQIEYIPGKKACGWAGGLNLENLPVLLPKMAQAADGKPFWIDMESSLRTNDWFDVDKAESILNAVRDFSIEYSQLKLLNKVA